MAFFHDTVRDAVDPSFKNQIKNFAFDGSSFYFTTSDNHIIKTDLCFGSVNNYQTARTYESICYDNKDCCFWAVTANNRDKIFRLNCFFTETDCIDLNWPDNYNTSILGLSYHCCNDSLLFAIGSDVFETDKNGTYKKIFSLSQCTINCVLSVCPGFILSAVKNNQQTVYTIKDGEVLCMENFDRRNLIRNMVFGPCSTDSNKMTFTLLVMGNFRNPYLVKNTADDIGFELSHCNYNICQKCCCKNPCDSINPCLDILESIALEEASLAHILNAEGEKLQKILAISDDINEILCANREINKTIIYVTHLEHVLYDKLAAVLESCCMDCSCSSNCHQKCNCHFKCHCNKKCICNTRPLCCKEKEICECDMDSGDPQQPE